MFRKPIKIDLTTVLSRTSQNREDLEHYRKFLDDPEKDRRLDSQQCVLCYYGSRIGGCAMTETECGFCGQRSLFGSTNVDVLCPRCAKTLKLCLHCGGDVALKNRRKL